MAHMVMRASINDLLPTQDRLFYETLDTFLNRFDAKLYEDPKVISFPYAPGKLILIDGHHKVYASAMKRNDSIDVTIIDKDSELPKYMLTSCYETIDEFIEDYMHNIKPDLEFAGIKDIHSLKLVHI